MKIKEEAFTATVRVKDYVEAIITRTEYGGGAIEDLNRQVAQQAAATGRLVEVLSENGNLSAPNVSFVATGFSCDSTFSL